MHHLLIYPPNHYIYNKYKLYPHIFSVSVVHFREYRKNTRGRSPNKLHACSLLFLFLVIQRGMRIIPLGFCLRVIVDEKPLISKDDIECSILMRNWEPRNAMSLQHVQTQYYLLGRPSLQHAVRASTMQKKSLHYAVKEPPLCSKRVSTMQ